MPPYIFPTALQLCPCTRLQPVVNICCGGTEKECTETTSDAWTCAKTQTSTDMKAFPPSSSATTAAMTTMWRCWSQRSGEEVAGMGKDAWWRLRRTVAWVSSLIYFYCNSDGICNFTPLFLPQCVLWLDDRWWVHYSKCFVFTFRQHEIWSISWQSILLITNQLLKDFLSYVDMFLSFWKFICFLQPGSGIIILLNRKKQKKPFCFTVESTRSCHEVRLL